MPQIPPSVNSLLLVAAEIALLSGLIFLLFRQRERIGLGPLFILIGANQVLAVVLGATVFFSLSDTIFFSPGSAVLFPSALMAALLLYLRESIPRTRTLILSVVFVNLMVTVMLWFVAVNASSLGPSLNAGLPLQVFLVEARVMVVGTATLLLDFFLLIILYQYLDRIAAWAPQTLRVGVSLVLILALDSVIFTVGAFGGKPIMASVLIGQLLSKTFSGAVFGILSGIYLRYIEPAAAAVDYRTDTFNVLSILTYRERYEMVKRELQEERATSLAKSKFLAHMSHELRTPLNAIIGFTKVLLAKDASLDEPKRKLYLSRVAQNGQHLLLLINDVLDLSKIDSGRLEITAHDIDLHELINDTVELVRGQALEKGLYLRTDLDDHPVYLSSDATKLRQILINLLGNAIKFTSRGGVTARLVTRANGSTADRLDVIDTGIGIPQEDFEHIFNAFRQVETGTTRSYEGTGLGLAISRALCERLGYRLTVDSREGEGSTFTIHFS